jgi:hypothetical protein
VPASARPVSRRTALGATLGGTLSVPGLLAGCSLDPPRPDPSSGAPTEPEPDADVALLGAVLGELDATAALVAATVDRHRRLATRLQPLLDVHASHRAVLDEAAGVDQDASGAPPVPGRPVAALDRVRRSETRLTGTLRQATGDAQSGDLARALASMAASLAQHLVVLGSEGPAA